MLFRDSAVGDVATPTLIAVKKIIPRGKTSIIKLSLGLTLPRKDVFMDLLIK